ncbi:MAG: hypothetical protein BGO10_03040 [Chlamydia sp. 32-24]|nr:MAG: hypothetical protein BGO10_03040 [Chlamydia sp. 32-24]
MENQKRHLQNFKTQLDSIATDIKNTQQLLRNYGVPISVRFHCESNTEFKGEDSIEMGPNGLEIHYSEYLLWDTIVSGSESDWALLYEKTEQEGYIECDGFILIDRGVIGRPKTIIKKRLIETSVDVRLRMYKYLEGFVNEVCKELKIDEFHATQQNLQNALKKIQPQIT